MHLGTHPVSAMATTGANRNPSSVLFRTRKARRDGLFHECGGRPLIVSEDGPLPYGGDWNGIG
jgi:hypothetical protein